MLNNLFGTLVFMLCIWLIGLAILKLTGSSWKQYKYIHFISMPLGFSVCTIIGMIIYFLLEQPVMIIRIAFGILAIASITLLLFKKLVKQELLGFLAMTAVFLIMILPGMVRGDQYYAHRGNIYDQHTYLCEIVYMSQHEYSYGESGLMQAEDASEIVQEGFQWITNDRPATALMAAVLSGKGWGNLFFQGYLYNMLLMTMMFGSMLFILDMIINNLKSTISNKRTSIIKIVLALAYIWGFYGQIQYDIDAWSQMSAMAVLVALVGVYFIIFLDILREDQGITKGRYTVLLIIGTGAFMLYPENTIFHGGLLVLVSLLACLISRKKVSLKTIGILMSIPILAVGITALADFRMVYFTLVQIFSSTSDKRQSWATYFDKYWLGYHTFLASSPIKETIKKIIAFLPSIFGMFIITPNYELRILPITLLWLAIVGLVSGSIICLWGKNMIHNFRTIHDKKWQPQAIDLYQIIGFCGLLVFLLLIMLQKYWSGGKILLYSSPYIFIVLSIPLLLFLLNGQTENQYTGKRKWLQGCILTTSALFITCQLVFAGMRVYDTVVNEAGNGYLGNYPSDQSPYLKENYRYNFNPKDYCQKERVAIAIEDPWYQQYIKQALSYEGIDYYTLAPDYAYYTLELRQAPLEPAVGDTVIELERRE